MLRFVREAYQPFTTKTAYSFFSANKDRFRNGCEMRRNRLSCRMSLKSGAGEFSAGRVLGESEVGYPAMREKACATCLFFEGFFFIRHERHSTL